MGRIPFFSQIHAFWMLKLVVVGGVGHHASLKHVQSPYTNRTIEKD